MKTERSTFALYLVGALIGHAALGAVLLAANAEDVGRKVAYMEQPRTTASLKVDRAPRSSSIPTYTKRFVRKEYSI